MICKRKKYKEPYFTPYSLSSNAIETLIKNWQKEIIKRNFIVDVYDPGPINSNLRRKSFPGEDFKNLISADTAAKKFLKKTNLII